jgi:hypothetical protein
MAPAIGVGAKLAKWKTTVLWRTLEARPGGNDCRTLLELTMPKIVSVLSSSSTSPAGFTLHDADHGYRVAERMADLVADTIKLLTDFELTLLLLSAYLHDIGMSPSGKTSTGVRNYLISGETELLSGSELAEIQLWLDKNWQGATAPLFKFPLEERQLSTLDEAHAYYCRSRHNDWSEDWIRANLKDISPALYPSWIEHLVMICRSHHEYLPDLREDRFNALIVGSPPQRVNPRYLACILRLSDVLEFDPERTPRVILDHRLIPASSKVFWYKDHAIGFRIEPESRRLTFTARTPNAAVHKAVLETADQVNFELSTCATLAHEGLLKSGTISEYEREAYGWTLPNQLSCDIKEIDGRFTYIQGAFRPSSTKILSLLSGTELYGEKYAAIRELIQNAYDAVREQLAFERLSLDKPIDDDQFALFSARHIVKLSVEEEGDKVWLVCSDTGVGMSKRIIENYLLVGGADVRPEIRSLERRAESLGFEVGRTGQFGIGILSYFMIADAIQLSTRRSQEGGDEDGTGWRFETEGLDSFGELTAISRSMRGTEVRLRLLADDAPDVSAMITEICAYISQTVQTAPCRTIITRQDGEEVASFGPGWCFSAEHYSKKLLEGMKARHRPYGLQTKQEQESRDRAEGVWAEIRDTIASNFEWFGPYEANLTSVAGSVRIWMPCTRVGDDLIAGLSYFKEGTAQRLPDGNFVHLTALGDVVSWRGFVTSGPAPVPVGLFAQVDYRSGMTIGVSRTELEHDEDGLFLQEIEEHALNFIDDFLSSKGDGKFRLISSLQFRRPTLTSFDRERTCWMFEDATTDHSLENLSGQILDIWVSDTTMDKIRVDDERYSKSKLVSRLSSDSFADARLCTNISGGRLVICLLKESETYTFGITWNPEDQIYSRNAAYATFPTGWEGLHAVSTPNGLIYNINLESDWTAVRFKSSEGVSASDFDESIKSHKAAISLLYSMCSYNFREWVAVQDNFPTQLKRVLEIAGYSSSNPLRIWSKGTYKLADCVIQIEPGQILSEEKPYVTDGLKCPDGTILQYKEPPITLVRIRTS